MTNFESRPFIQFAHLFRAFLSEAGWAVDITCNKISKNDHVIDTKIWFINRINEQG